MSTACSTARSSAPGSIPSSSTSTAAGPLERPQGLGLTSAAVQGEHQPGPPLLAEGLGHGQRLGEGGGT